MSPLAATHDAMQRLMHNAMGTVAHPQGTMLYSLRLVEFHDLSASAAKEIGQLVLPGVPCLRWTCECTFYEVCFDPLDIVAYIALTMDGSIKDLAVRALNRERLLAGRAAATFAREDAHFAFDRGPKTMWPLIGTYRAERVCICDKNLPLLVEAAHTIGVELGRV
jgi:hypothetical protein